MGGRNRPIRTDLETTTASGATVAVDVSPPLLGRNGVLRARAYAGPAAPSGVATTANLVVIPFPLDCPTLVPADLEAVTAADALVGVQLDLFCRNVDGLRFTNGLAIAALHTLC